MKTDIIKELESNGFDKVSDQTHYNPQTKIEVIIIEEQCSVSNGNKKLYMGDLNKEEIFKNIK